MEKKNLKSNAATGVSSAVGAAVGVVAGTMASEEVHAAEISDIQQDEPLPEEEEIEVVDADPASSQSSAQQTEPEAEPVAEPVEPTPQPGDDPVAMVVHTSDGDLEVMSAETIANEDGSHSDVYVVTDGTDQAMLIDANQDGVIEGMVSDFNHDGQITEDEILDVTASNMTVESVSAASDAGLMAQNDAGDYINDADVSGFMA